MHSVKSAFFCFNTYFIFLPMNLVTKVANVTTEIELIGINIAANTGERLPDRAQAIPKILYKNEIAKLIFTILIDV